MNSVEDSPLLVVRNTNDVPSRIDGEVYEFITSKGKILAFRSDDDKAMTLYGPIGEVVPASEAGDDAEFEIRDHRQDEDNDSDVQEDGLEPA